MHKVHRHGVRLQIFRLRLETFDWNCQQHITPRFTEEEVAKATHVLRERLAQLESENAALRARLEPGGALAQFEARGAG